MAKHTTQNFHHVTIFDSLSEAVRLTKAQPGRGAQEADGHWMAHVHQLDAAPNPVHLEAVKALRAKLVGRADWASDVPRRVRRRAQTWGSAFSPDKFLRRDPNGWDRRVRTRMPVRRIHLGIHVGGLGGVRVEDTVHRGAAALAFADWLQAGGVQVQISAFWHSNRTAAGHRDSTSMTFVTVKPLGGAFNASAIAKVSCDLAWNRQVFLFARERFATYRIADGMGRTKDLTREEEEAYGLDLVIPETVQSEASAIQWLNEARAKAQARMVTA